MEPHWFTGEVLGRCEVMHGMTGCNRPEQDRVHYDVHPSVRRDPEIPTDFYGRRSEDGMLKLRQEFDRLLDETGVKDERIRSLRRQLAAALEAVEKQALTLARIDELVGQRDMVRGSELRTLLEQVR